MADFVKSVTRYSNPERMSTVLNIECEIFDRYLHKYMLDDIANRITEEVAKAYVAQHGDEMLKALQEKTIDAKLIQKVVANLRKELKPRPEEGEKK